MQKKKLAILCLALGVAIVVSIVFAVAVPLIMRSIEEGKHTYMDGWSNDENSHWKTCSEFECLMAGTRFKEAKHTFEYGEPEIIRSVGSPDKTKVTKTCKVCGYEDADITEGELVYGSKEYPASPEDMGPVYFGDGEMYPSFSHGDTFEYYCKLDFETAGTITFTRGYYTGNRWNPRSPEGTFTLYDSDWNEVSLAKQSDLSYDKGSYRFDIFKAEIGRGSYYLHLKITEKGDGGSYSYKVNYSFQASGADPAAV